MVPKIEAVKNERSKNVRFSTHFKGLISGKVEPEAQGRDSTFTYRKKAILHYKIEFGQILLHKTVLSKCIKVFKNEI